MPEGLVRERPDDTVTRDTLGPALAAPGIGLRTRHSMSVRSGSRCCPIASRPSSSSRQNVVRSGVEKVALSTETS